MHESDGTGGLLNHGARVLAALTAAIWFGGCDDGSVVEHGRARGGDTATDAGLATADAQRGRRLLAQYHCGSCHTIPGVASARGRVAVTLASFGSRSYIAGHVPNTPEHLIRWITDPALLVPQTAMPDMGVSTADARDMAAYLDNLR